MRGATVRRTLRNPPPMRGAGASGGIGPVAGYDLRWRTDDPTATVDADLYTTIPNAGAYGGTFGEAGTKRPAVAALQVGAMSKRVALFDDTDDQHVSTLAAADWIASHQEWTWGFAAKCTDDTGGCMVAATANAATVTGVRVYRTSSNDAPRLLINNSSGVNWLVADGNASSWPLDDLIIVIIRHSQAGGWDIRVDGSSVGSGALPGAPPSGNPFATLYIGTSFGTLPFAGNLCELLGYARHLSDAEVVSLEAYLAKAWQNPNLLLQQQPSVLLLDGMGYTVDTGNGEAGQQIAVWADQSGHDRDDTQTTDADQPSLIEGLDSALRFDGVSDHLDSASDAISGLAAATRAVAFKATDTATGQYIVDTDGLSLSVRLDTNKLRVYATSGDYGEVAFTDTTAGHGVIAIYDGSLSGNTNRLKVYLDGVQQTLSFTGTIPAALGADTAACLGVGSDGSTDPFAGDIYLHAVYPAAKSGGDLTDIVNGMAERLSFL